MWGRIEPGIAVPSALGPTHELTIVPTRVVVCSCGAVLIEIPDEMPASPRYIDRTEFAQHARAAKVDAFQLGHDHR